MNKFFKIKSTLSGDILFTATELSGLVQIINETTIYLPFNNSDTVLEIEFPGVIIDDVFLVL
jgi:hypothetical protein